MNGLSHVPRILVIDDLFGRIHADRRNEERASLCGQYLLMDVTGDEVGKAAPQGIIAPVAEALFFRGQRPLCSNVNDTVENDLESTLEFVRRGWTDCPLGQPPWSMVLLDLCFYTGRVTVDSSRRRGLGMPEGRSADDDPGHYFGMEILRALHMNFPDLPVVMLSSMPRDEVSRDFTEHGAYGFLPRGDANSPDLLRQYLWRHGLISDATDDIVGYSHQNLLALRSARKAAENDQNVLIRGESGTGKELIARYISRQRKGSTRSPFVVVPGPLLTDELFASVLFGIEAGVATNVKKSPGLIMEAESGDLFFDEIADMPTKVQAGILRVLEDRMISHVGSGKMRTLNVRFLSATNVDIESRAAEGTFRADLLYRLRQGGTIYLPPLRSRHKDIPVLAHKFVREAESKHPGALQRDITNSALDKLLSHDWPGNIRELRDCLYQAVNQYPDVEHLVPDHFSIFDSPSNRPHRHEELASTHTKAPLERAVTPDMLASLLDAIEYGSVDPVSYAGKLEDLNLAWARFMCRLLKAALLATQKRTPEHPGGEVFPLPALKLLTGNKHLKAWQAYDIIKRISQTTPQLRQELMSDPVLKDIVEKAVQSRKGK